MKKIKTKNNSNWYEVLEGYFEDGIGWYKDAFGV